MSLTCMSSENIQKNENGTHLQELEEKSEE